MVDAASKEKDTSVRLVRRAGARASLRPLTVPNAAIVAKCGFDPGYESRMLSAANRREFVMYQAKALQASTHHGRRDAPRVVC